MVLSGQTIRALGMLTPFHERKVHELTGMSFGLSCAGYDIRLANTVLLDARSFALGVSMEYFDMPVNVMARVADKSTLARQGISVFNTIIEPGWRGFLTIEIANHSDEVRRLVHGQPIAQIIFQFTDAAVERPYAGKYQDADKKPQPPLREIPAREGLKVF